jgi:iron complex outermembrane receptor protein
LDNAKKYYDLYLPKNSVAVALDELAAKTQTLILFPYDAASKKQANFVVGRYTLEGALSTMLVDSGYTGEILDNGSIKITYSNVDDLSLALNSIVQSEIVEVKKPTVFEDEVEIIEVSGFISSIKRSLNHKRYSNIIVDSISSEDLGVFPDQNISEALQRITGVSIDRSRGEGRFLTVRGFGPEFNAVLYNGRILPTENSGREFSFDILSDDLISNASVYKTTSANISSGGIGSTVDLTSLKPMDYTGMRSYLSVNTTYDSLSKNNFYQYSALSSYSTDKFGVLFSVNFENREYRIDTANTNGWILTDLDYVNNNVGVGDFTNARIPTNLDFRVDSGTRERVGGTLVFQYHVMRDLFVTFDYLYSKFIVDSNVSSSANWTHYLGDSFDTVELDKNGTLLTYQYKSGSNFSTDIVELSYNRPTETNQVGLNFNYQANENLGFMFDASYANATNKNGGNDSFVIVGTPNANPIYEFTVGDNYAAVTYEQPVTLNDLRSHGVTFEGDDTNDEIIQVKLNGNYSINFGVIDDITFGFYQSIRDKNKETFKTLWGAEFDGYILDVPNYLFSTIDTTNFLDSLVPISMFSFDTSEYIEFLWSDQNLDHQVKNLKPESYEYLKQLQSTGYGAVYRPTDSWRVKENIKEVFFNIDISGNIEGLQWIGDFGVRYANTRINSIGFPQYITNILYNLNDPTNLGINLSEPEIMTEENNYSHLLPSINMKLDLTDEQVLRFGMSKTITRPNLNDLSVSTGQYNARVGASTAVRGNPYLEPYESSNFDMAWSWYYQQESFVGMEFFYKGISQYISEVSEHEVLFDHPEGDFLITDLQNTNNSSIQGIEFATFYQFSESNILLSGFGAQANYTYVNSRDNYHPINNSTAFALEGLSDSYNMIIFYNKHDFQWRLSYNHRAEFLREINGAQGQPEMVGEYGQLDANFSYKYNDNLILFLEGKNILNKKLRTFSIFKERLLSYENTGSRFRFGIKYIFDN